MRTATFLEYPCFIDMLALCTGMRPVIMVDYGGKMPELQEHLCGVLKLSQKESSMFENLRVMVIEDMIYLIHIKWLAEFVRSSLNSETELLFADLEQDPPKMITHAEESSVAMELVSVQKWFSLIFPVDRMNSDPLPSHRIDSMSSGKSRIEELVMSQSSELIDLSRCMQETEITIPTLNGKRSLYDILDGGTILLKCEINPVFCYRWLLGYPIVYLFSKEHISDAIYNLSTKSLHLFKVLVRSFSVPYELSLEGRNEPWAETFISQMRAKWERCKQVWGSLHMEVSSCYPQAIVL
ncbi:hypothetical protein RHGRI_025678 [Rhododendron griersonianum]|uniref:Uncharacterized protein n=1 Tax=Rhododendron griersonianum TaxID=479676 RepID=A0AAV6IUR6_9ERIC|nr:hypothetical protein RHGRI_025678 [Rhododendron griersonianum]